MKKVTTGIEPGQDMKKISSLRNSLNFVSFICLLCFFASPFLSLSKLHVPPVVFQLIRQSEESAALL
jgi:hypothetical protein